MPLPLGVIQTNNITTMKVDLFSWGGEDLTFEDVTGITT